MSEEQHSEISLSVIERMEEIIQEKEREIDKLQDKLEIAENYADCKAWCRPHKILGRKDLPFPRLEIELVIHSEYEHEWNYFLVYKHVTDYFGDDESQLTGIPLGNTTSRGGHYYDKYDCLENVYNALPHRDGFHIRRDSHQFNLKAFAITPGGVYELEPIKKD